ncbi:MAG: type IX secretion system membrane protein PorP/SprF [Prolixibacteraceae bacterium]|nr:type IX secretion system membrane protein PorP/SprF [Prolixibacteraceae bacterium]MBN2775476.1 type IX secretion system membrane protein PorP/SprF [Prolixibacteraceae bacterium]
MFGIGEYINKVALIKRLVSLKSVILISLLSMVYSGFAQQDPGYTQYMFNQQTVNPAYVGTWESIGFMALTRKQWVGFEGAPSTQTLAFQTPLQKENVGLGLTVVNDQIGKEKRFSLAADYSYKVKLTNDISLRLGMKGGFTNYSHDLTQYQLDSQNTPDQMYQGEIDQKFMPNVGIGAFLHSKKFYLGFSVPKLIQNEFKDNENFSTYAEMRHFFLTGAYVFDLNESIKFKPTFLTKAAIGSPVQLDLSANFLLKEKFWLGAMYRTGDSFGFIAQWVFDKKLRIGYAIDFTTTNLRNYHDGVHEIMVSYELNFLKTRVASPRYF